MAEPVAAPIMAEPELRLPPGQRSGGGTRTVVLLHAYPVDGRIFAAQLPPLAAAGWHVLAPDLPGFGAAPGPEVDPTVPDLADATARFLRRETEPPVVLGGLSRGGYVALALADRHPDLLAGLVLLGTRPGLDPPDERRFFVDLATTAERDGPAAVAEVMLPQVLGPRARATRPGLVSAVRDLIAGQETAALAAGARSMNTRADTTPVLSRIRVPCLVVVGADDPHAGDTAAMARQVPGARLVTVPDAGHYVNAERPDEVNEALVEFLRARGSR